jgi:hypothetical protein
MYIVVENEVGSAGLYVSIHLHGGGRGYHLLTTPGPFPSSMGIEGGYDSHNKRSYVPHKCSGVVSMDRKGNEE